MAQSQLFNIHEVRVPVLPGETSVRAVMSEEPKWLAVLPAGRAPRVYHIGTTNEIELGFLEPASSLSFRPTRQGMAHNPEIAVAAGERSAGVERFDLSLEASAGVLPLDGAACVAYSGDGKLLAAGSASGNVVVWNLERRAEPVLDIRVGSRRVNGLAFSAQNKTLYVCDVSGEFVKVDLEENALPELCLSETRTDGSPFQFECYSVACHPSNEKKAAFGGDDSHAYLVDYSGPRVHELATACGGYIRQVEFLPNGMELVLIGASAVEVWNIHAIERVRSYVPRDGRALAARQYGGYLYVAVA